MILSLLAPQDAEGGYRYLNQLREAGGAFDHITCTRQAAASSPALLVVRAAGFPSSWSVRGAERVHTPNNSSFHPLTGMCSRCGWEAIALPPGPPRPR